MVSISNFFCPYNGYYPFDCTQQYPIVPNSIPSNRLSCFRRRSNVNKGLKLNWLSIGCRIGCQTGSLIKENCFSRTNPGPIFLAQQLSKSKREKLESGFFFEPNKDRNFLRTRYDVHLELRALIKPRFQNGITIVSKIQFNLVARQTNGKFTNSLIH